jgi:hypothetical protein
LSFLTQQGKHRISGRDPSRGANIVVVVVVVEVQAENGARGLTTSKEPVPMSISCTRARNSIFICPHLLYIIWRPELLYSFSPDIGTKFCLDARYYDP